jgi:hypothetical protein
VSGDLICPSDLSEDFRLADYERVNSCGHAKQVPDRSLVVVRVQAIGEFFGRDMTKLR